MGDRELGNSTVLLVRLAVNRRRRRLRSSADTFFVESPFLVFRSLSLSPKRFVLSVPISDRIWSRRKVAKNCNTRSIKADATDLCVKTQQGQITKPLYEMWWRGEYYIPTWAFSYTVQCQSLLSWLFSFGVLSRDVATYRP